MAVTSNLGLKLPEKTDYFNIDDFNENFKKIDASAGNKEVSYKDLGFLFNLSEIDNLTENGIIYRFVAQEDLSSALGGSFLYELRYVEPENSDAYQIVTSAYYQNTLVRRRLINSDEWSPFIDRTLPESGITWDTLSTSLQSTINSKADIETGTITRDNTAWYANDSTKKMTGTYELNGDYCTITATANLINGWGNVYYSLPVSAVGVGATIFVGASNIYTIETNKLSNISVLEIKTIDGALMTNENVSFTLRYKYK